MPLSSTPAKGRSIRIVGKFCLLPAFLLFFLPCKSWSQCTLTCIDVQVSLNASCTAWIDPIVLLAGNPGPGCLDHLVVQLFDEDGHPIPGSPLLTGDYVNQTISANVVDTLNGNFCTGEILLEDKLPPSITCEDVTVSCFDPTDPVSIGLPQMEDNCTDTLTVSYVDSPVYTNCAQSDTIQRINRVWSVADGSGHSSHCIQKIFVVRPPLSALSMPPDWDGSQAPPLYCPATDVSPAITGFPSFNGYAIDSICGFEAFFEDVSVATCQGSYSIFREWEIYDGCRGESIQHTQHIAVQDTLPPTMVCPDDVEVNTSNLDCTATIIFPEPATADSCGSAVSISVEGSFGLVQGTTIYNLGYGEYDAACQATDECGNTATCLFKITVHDIVPPVAVSVSNANITLLPTSPTLVNASTFDDGSWDNCGAVTIDARRMDSPYCDGDDSTPFGPKVPFFCCDVGHPVMIELRVTDQDGNISTGFSSAQVTDNLNPGILCPDDIVLDCQGDYSDLSVTGLPLASDNCPDYEVSYFDSIQINSCGAGFVWREWMIEDAVGRTASCLQTISIQNQEPFFINPADPNDPNDDIIWPQDFTSPTCGAGIDPDNLPAENAYPQITADTVCAHVAYNYSDTYLNSPSACVQILREWLVIDWCQFNPITQAGIWKYIQVIEVTNSDPPVILSPCEDLTFCHFDADCQEGGVLIAVEAEDDCTPVERLSFRYTVDLFDDGTDDESGEGQEISGNYPPGTHRYAFEVEDDCGNHTICTRTFTIYDCKKPSPVCESLIVEIMNLPDPMVQVGALAFDESSFDNCTEGGSLQFSFSPDIADSVRVFTCANIGANDLEIWVTDKEGNQDYCAVELIVQNNLAACTSQTSISGAISTASDSPVANAWVALNSSDSIQTSPSGLFLFDFLPEGGDYTILPSKTEDPANGVTTFDMVLVSRHILGVVSLDSPYKIIAADANRSGAVTTLDLVEIRKVILGIQPGFSQNTSWRFVDKNYVFPNPANPFLEPFPESVSFNNLNGPGTADFIAIKTGDVNDSADPLE